MTQDGLTAFGSDGKQRWQASGTEAEYDVTSVNGSAIIGSTVYGPDGHTSTLPGNLIAVLPDCDLLTEGQDGVVLTSLQGKSKWRHNLATVGDTAVLGTSTAGGGLVAIGQQNDPSYTISALALSDGHQLWQQQTSTPGGGTNVVGALAGQVIVIGPQPLQLFNAVDGSTLPSPSSDAQVEEGGSGGFYCDCVLGDPPAALDLSSDSGSVVISLTNGQTIATPDKAVRAGSGWLASDAANNLMFYPSGSTTAAWSAAGPQPGDNSSSSLEAGCSVGDRVVAAFDGYAVTFDGHGQKIGSIDLYDEQLLPHELGDILQCSPLGDKLVLTGTYGTVEIDPATGKTVFAIDGEVHTDDAPTYGSAGDEVFVKTQGTLLALDAMTGAQRWEAAIPN